MTLDDHPPGNPTVKINAPPSFRGKISSTKSTALPFYLQPHNRKGTENKRVKEDAMNHKLVPLNWEATPLTTVVPVGPNPVNTDDGGGGIIEDGVFVPVGAVPEFDVLPVL